MSKVSIAFRGWRFDESAVFDEDGSFRALGAMAEETRERVTRLFALREEPCHACWLVHGEDRDEHEEASVIYGEPFAEVLLCPEHERDFYYWFSAAGGAQFRGTDAFQDEFHQWFLDGNRAPDSFQSVEHVETAPESLPEQDSPGLSALTVDLPPDEQLRYDLRTGAAKRGHAASDTDRPTRDAAEDTPDSASAANGGPASVETASLDLDVEYPSSE